MSRVIFCGRTPLRIERAYAAAPLGLSMRIPKWLGGAGVAQRTVGDRPRDPTDGVVDDFVPGHHLQRIGAGLSATVRESTGSCPSSQSTATASANLGVVDGAPGGAWRVAGDWPHAHRPAARCHRAAVVRCGAETGPGAVDASGQVIGTGKTADYEFSGTTLDGEPFDGTSWKASRRSSGSGRPGARPAALRSPTSPGWPRSTGARSPSSESADSTARTRSDRWPSRSRTSPTS